MATKKKTKTSFKGETFILAVLDMSGSMKPLESELVTGYNQWLEDTRSVEGVCYLSTNLFNTAVTPYGPISGNIEDAPLLDDTYRPGGFTALNDAFGEGVTTLRAKVGKHDRALVLIITDGQENASREWDTAKVKSLITELEGAGNWTFTYLSSAPSAWTDAKAVGTQLLNTMTFDSTPVGMAGAMASASTSTRSYRSGGGQSVSSFYTPVADQAEEMKKRISTPKP